MIVDRPRMMCLMDYMPVYTSRMLKTIAVMLLALVTSPMALAGWVAVGAKGTILNSSDGITWLEADSDTTETLRGVDFDGVDTWTASGQSGTVVRSNDAQNWMQQISGNNDALWSTVFEGGQWIVSGGRGRILTSPDGIAWTSVNSNFSFTLFDIAYNQNNLYAIAGDLGIATTVLTSPDATTWTQNPPQPNNAEGLYGITYDNTIWIAVGDKGKILTTSDPDSRSWAEQPSGTDTDLRDIVYNGTDLYIVVGREGAILTSPDAVTWTPSDSGTTFDLFGVAYDGSGQYIAVGDEGTILTSSDGFSWSTKESPTFRFLYDVASGKLPQTINFPAQSTLFQNFSASGSYSLGPEATASSGLAVTYTTLTAGVCSITDTTVTMISLGECQIEASQPGDSTYLPAEPVTQSILQISTPSPGVPTNPGLVFDPQDSEVFAPSGSFTLTPPANTTQTPVDPQPEIAYASSTPSICSIPLRGSTEVTMLSVGTCSIVAASAPNSLYSSGGPVTASIAILKRPQNITFGPQASQDFVLNSTFALNPEASASSGLPLEYSSLSPSICNSNGATITMFAAGNCTIEATQNGDDTWEPATPVSQTISLVVPPKQPQVIDFPAQVPLFQDAIPGASYPLSPEAASSSGLPISYRALSPGVCTLSGITVTITGAGACRIEASQPGDDNYLPAVPAIQSVLHILTPPGPGVPTKPGLLFDPQDSELFSAGTTFVLSPAATTTQTPVDPQPVIVYVSSTPSVCTIPFQGSLEVTMLTLGDCTIIAASAPNSLYSIGGPVAGTINIYKLAIPAVPVPTLPQPLLWLLGALAAAVAASKLRRGTQKLSA